jgi:colanic acid biosynthesis glycosyl transferase WcaI
MLCEDLARLGHEVSVIAAVPHYPTGRVPRKFRGSLLRRETVNGVDITRVWVPSVNRARLSQRLLTFLAFQFLSAVTGMGRRYDVLIAGNPALEVFLPFWVLTALRRKPAIFSVHDLYPDVGVRLGIFRHKWIISLVKGMEDYCLHKAARVRVLSEGFRNAVLARGIPDSKIVLVWDWLDTDFIKPLPPVNPVSREWGLDGRFVALYAGNMSFSQGLECVLAAARLLAGEPEIQFVFVGDGAEKRSLQEQAARERLANVRFFPFQPRESLPYVLATADVSLICLRRGISADSVPSKFYSILASARPVVAAVDPGSDTWRLVEESGCGVCVNPEDPAAMSDAILSLYRDSARRAGMGRKGRDYVVDRHGRAAAARKFHEALETMQTNRLAGAGPVLA